MASDAIVAMVCFDLGVKMLVMESRDFGVFGDIESAGQIDFGLEIAFLGQILIGTTQVSSKLRCWNARSIMLVGFTS